MHQRSALKVTFHSITLGVMLFISALSNGAEPITIAIGNYYPYNNEQSQGLISDLYRAAFAEVNQPVTFITTPIRRGVSLLLHGQIDAFSSGNLFVQGAQKELITWTPTYKVMMASFFLSPGQHAPQPLKDISDLRGYRVGVVFNSVTLALFDQHQVTVTQLQTPDQLLHVTQRGRLDYFTVGLLSGLLLIDKHFPDNWQQFDHHPWYSIDPGLTFLKSDQRALELQARYEIGLGKIKKNGRYLQILEAYWGKGNVPKLALPVELQPYGVDRIDPARFHALKRDSSGKLIEAP
ncbi:MAG: transporter substrate-binding domain-containing protein [Motiliproteus sp.]